VRNLMATSLGKAKPRHQITPNPGRTDDCRMHVISDGSSIAVRPSSDAVNNHDPQDVRGEITRNVGLKLSGEDRDDDAVVPALADVPGQLAGLIPDSADIDCRDLSKSTFAGDPWIISGFLFAPADCDPTYHYSVLCKRAAQVLREGIRASQVRHAE